MSGNVRAMLIALAPLLLIGASPVAEQGSVAAASTGERVPEVSLHVSAVAPDPGLIRMAAPTGEARDWVGAADYPEAARREGRDAQLFIELIVDSADRATDCRIAFVQRAGGKDFERDACAILLSRGRFLHAIDVDGHPRPGSVRFVMTFSLHEPDQPGYRPSPPPPRPLVRAEPALSDPRGLTMAGSRDLFPNIHPMALLDVDRDGRVSHCRIVASAGSDRGDVAVCRHLNGLRFEPARDIDGRHIAFGNHFVRMDVVE